MDQMRPVALRAVYGRELEPVEDFIGFIEAMRIDGGWKLSLVVKEKSTENQERAEFSPILRSESLPQCCPDVLIVRSLEGQGLIAIFNWLGTRFVAPINHILNSRPTPNDDEPRHHRHYLL